jgi:hypothetical protein
MRSNRIIAGVAFALASTGALAVSGERWQGTNRGFAEVPEPIVVTRTVPDSAYVYTYPERDVVIERRIVAPEPVLVERTYVVDPPYAYLVSREPDMVKRLNPETGHYIGQGLFNRTGPNDFGG